MLSRFLLLLTLLPSFAQALNPHTALPDYHHTIWTNRDGAPSGIISMAQAKDGRLWMVTPFGLYHFDGVRFEQYKMPLNDRGLILQFSMVRAHPNGDLYLAYAGVGGIAVLHPDGKLEELVPLGKLPPVTQLAFDGNGDIWASSTLGLFRIRKGQIKRYVPENNMAVVSGDVRIDRYNRLWSAGENTVHLYDRATDSFKLVRKLSKPGELIESPDGRIWTADYDQVEALPAPDDPSIAMQAPNIINTPGYGSNWIARFDRDGNLWQLKCPGDLCVTPAHAVEKTNLIKAPPAPENQRIAPGVAALAGNTIIEDREHNIWVATMEGLDRYRDTRMQRYRLSTSRATHMMTVDENGQLWVSNPHTNTIWKMRAGAEPERDPTPAWVTAKSREGGLLLPWTRDIEHRYRGKVEKIPMPEFPGPDGKPQNLMVLGLTDDGKRLWLVTIQTGLVIKTGNGPWVPRARMNLPDKIVLGTPGVKPGQTWLLCAGGQVVLIDENDKLTTYSLPSLGVGRGMFAGEDIVASGEQGVAVLIGDRFRMLQVDDAEVLQNVSGMAVTPDGDRWFNGGKGLVHVTRDAWNNALMRPDLPLRYELFGVEDGYVGKAMLEHRHPTAKLDKDGQLWLNSTGGLLRFDTRNIARNPVAPVVNLHSVHAGSAAYPIRQAALTLPSGAQNFNINYSAASLRQPQNVRFQYRLDGADGDWQDAGPRRTAYYTNVSPGAYRFQVRAANEDGVWSVQPASVDVEIPPGFTQTLWFKAACILAAVAALYALYLYRLRVVTARLEERMEVRLAERERIARTLHDTFLQTVQGVVLRLDAAVDALPDDSAARKALAPVLHSARDSISEGRAQVHELRSAGADEMECQLRDVAALLAASYPGVRFTLGVTGARQALRAEAAEEISEIGREAVRNAYQHAQATQIEVQLSYGAGEFTLLVRDNGIGMPPAPAAPGHWGLLGMRERAARIGASLLIDGTPDAGTTVTITLLARTAYAGHRLPWWRRRPG
ncbi:sensor histidine kinase [Duganella radicis]|uniref:Histidine kinase/HSP90-like ATPase domain-containing protein n=1 Tax=Duganella radicis TaxID=551988 RepID=A0A6L6PBS2_9BURK|nr:sensor histidine kinase [Duganella radicis]MTV36522.1 hypothetical protein [Duganella radicis]